MITSFVLSLREGLEAALIIGIVMGALRRANRADLARSLWAGVISAIILSVLAAIVLHTIGTELEGTAEQLYEGITFLLAAGVLTWMIFWMSGQSKSMLSHLKSSIDQAAKVGGAGAVFFLAFIAVLREGIELALYLLAASFASGGVQTILGTSIGLLSACLLGYLLYTATIRLNLQRFFQLTALILIFFAAGLIAHGIAEFNEAGIIPTIVNPIWNLNPYLNEQSAVGIVLNTLFGYRSSPSLTQALGYSAYILIIALFFFKAKKVRAG